VRTPFSKISNSRARFRALAADIHDRVIRPNIAREFGTPTPSVNANQRRLTLDACDVLLHARRVVVVDHAQENFPPPQVCSAQIVIVAAPCAEEALWLSQMQQATEAHAVWMVSRQTGWSTSGELSRVQESSEAGAADESTLGRELAEKHNMQFIQLEADQSDELEYRLLQALRDILQPEEPSPTPANQHCCPHDGPESCASPPGSPIPREPTPGCQLCAIA